MRFMVTDKRRSERGGRNGRVGLLERMTVFKEELVRAGVMLAGGPSSESEGVARRSSSGFRAQGDRRPVRETKELLAALRCGS